MRLELILLISILGFIFLLFILFIVLFMFDLRIKKKYDLSKLEQIKEIKEDKVIEIEDNDDEEEEVVEVVEDIPLVEKNDINNLISINPIMHRPAYFKKNKMVLHYSNIGNPFIEIILYKANNIEKKWLYKLGDYQIENGLLVSAEGIANAIKQEFETCYNFELVLSCKEVFKNIVSLPSISKGKADSLYKKEIKNNFKEIKGNYKTINYINKTSLGYIYYTYFLPQNIITSFEKLAKLLKVKLNTINLYSDYLFKQIPIKNNFSCIYNENNVSTMFLVINNSLVTTHTFKYDKVEDIAVNYSLYIGKYEVELEHTKLEYLILDENDNTDIEKYLPSLKAVKLDFNKFSYKSNGVK